MHAKAIDNSARGFLIVLLPVAFLFAFLFVAWPVVLGVILVGILFKLWQVYQVRQLSKRINPFFHQLLKETQGRVTTLDLAMKVNLSASAAKQYLESKAQEFGAQRQDYPEQGSVYYFVTAGTLGSLFDDSEPSSPYPSQPVMDEASEPLESSPEDEQPQSPDSAETEQGEEHSPEKQIPKSLIQSELAKRLNVHSSTVLKRKTESYFADWSRGRDPEGIAWKYSPKTKLFFPIENQLPEESKGNKAQK